MASISGLRRPGVSGRECGRLDYQRVTAATFSDARKEMLMSHESISRISSFPWRAVVCELRARGGLRLVDFFLK